MGNRRGNPNHPLGWDDQKREFEKDRNNQAIQKMVGFKSELVIDISEADFMKIWNAAETKVMADNNLLEELDLGYLKPEAMGSNEFYNKFCINTNTDHEMVEGKLKAIMAHKQFGHLSMDVYFNDCDDTFVCRFSNFNKDVSKVKHFRNKNLIDSLNQALEFIVKREM